jgi:predicted ArsR family transcriptional regulator
MGRNTLKVRVLESLDERGWLNTAMVSHLAGLRPVRAVSTYLERLRKWGLVRRRRSRSGRGRQISLYAISERGHARLVWLREHRMRIREIREQENKK